MCCRTLWTAEPVAALGRLASAALPEPGHWARLLWDHPLWRKIFFRQHQRREESEVSIWTGCFPKVSLKAWLRVVWRLPHFLPAWWKLFSWFLELALWKYTPFLSIHLYIASFCNDASPSQAASCWHQLNVALKSEAEGSLPEWAGRQPNGHPVCCLNFLWCPNSRSWVAIKHCGSLGFSICHNVYTLVPLRGCRG